MGFVLRRAQRTLKETPTDLPLGGNVWESCGFGGNGPIEHRELQLRHANSCLVIYMSAELFGAV